jgi:hypothetical protein
MHQRFEYLPRYYDPDKEELERKKKMYGKDKAAEEEVKSRISSGFRTRSSYARSNQYQKQVRRAGYLRLAVLAVLILLIFLYIQAYLPEILALMAE